MHKHFRVHHKRIFQHWLFVLYTGGLIGAKQMRSDQKYHNGKPVYTDVEECIQRAGGVGKFQFIAFAMIVCGMVCGAFVLYCISYFTHEPPLLCFNEELWKWESCEKADACKKGVIYQPDPDAIDTLKN